MGNFGAVPNRSLAFYIKPKVGLVRPLKVKVIYNQQKLRWPYLIVDCSIDVLPEISSAGPLISSLILNIVGDSVSVTPIVHTLETQAPYDRALCGREIACKQTELVFAENICENPWLYIATDVDSYT